MRIFATALLAAFGIAAFGAAAPAADPAAEAKLAATAKALFKDVRTETLPNGLRVYLLPVPGSPVVTTMVAYKVGSGDEDKDQTGLSHYLEHLLFKGTDKYAPGDIDRATQRAGGHNNAYTSEDMTVYHFDFAADRWQVALEIEADRMRNVKIDAKHEFQQEKGAVIAELARNEDRPWDLEYKTILPLLYSKAAPYSHPVIGQEAHVRGATAETIKRHYDKWYHPNNASLIVCGGFDADAALAKIAALFGPIPKADLPPRKPAPTDAPRTKQARKEFESKFDVPRLMAGFNTVPVGDPDDYVLDVISGLLSTGKTSRLYKRLVDGEQLAAEVSAGNNAGRYPGWFNVQLEMLKGKDRAKAEAAVFAELKKLAAEPVAAAELARVRRGLLASYVFSREGTHALADNVAKSVTYSGLDYLTTYLDRIAAVTPADVQRAAAKYFAPEAAVVVWSLPAEEKPAKVGAAPLKPADRGAAPGKVQRAGPDALPAGFAMSNAKRVVLKNGLKLILLENHRLPILSATVAVADVRLSEPADKIGVAALVGQMLEEGTARHGGDEIATLIEDVGGTLALASGGGSLKVLSADAALGLGLLFECLTVPTFPDDRLEAKRQILLAAIADDETQPQNRASNLFKATVYGDHPWGRPPTGRKEVVAKLTAKECREFHASRFTPDRATAVIVGDFDAAEMVKTVEALTADWKRGPAVDVAVAAPPAPVTPVQMIVSDPTAAQTHIFIGHLGIKRDDPDYHALLVMDNVLGVGAGFTDRLSSTLRDRQGLAYTVTASIAASAGEQPGAFTGYIGTFPDKFAWVRDGFMKEFLRIRDEAPTEQEVEDAKKYLLGSMPFRLTTTGDVAAELLAAEKYGLGFDVMDKYRSAIEAVTPAMVQAAAKKHLDPKKIAVVAVGPIDAQGRPLPAAKEKP